MEHKELDELVAAILAAGSLSATSNRAPKQMVSRYRAILEELRTTGAHAATDTPSGQDE
jgi:hypothetical protein